MLQTLYIAVTKG